MSSEGEKSWRVVCCEGGKGGRAVTWKYGKGGRIVRLQGWTGWSAVV